MFLPPESTVTHESIIDAAVKAGVKRFFPSEYGVRSNHPDFANGPLITKKKNSIVKHLEKTQHVMSWTVLFCNPWIDFVCFPEFFATVARPPGETIKNK